MKKYFRTTLLGLMIWGIPFLTGFLFYNQSGELSVDIFLFKTVMLIVGAIGGAWAIILFFKKVEQSYLQESILAGLIWFAVNILLDIIILLPINGMGMEEYFVQIGLRYLSIPITVILCGYLLGKKELAKS